jgi:hypothetical protein
MFTVIVEFSSFVSVSICDWALRWKNIVISIVSMLDSRFSYEFVTLSCGDFVIAADMFDTSCCSFASPSAMDAVEGSVPRVVACRVALVREYVVDFEATRAVCVGTEIVRLCV